MRYVMLTVAVLTVFGVFVAGCSKKGAPVADIEPTPASVTVGPASGFDVSYEPSDVKASVKPYVVKPDLSNVANRSQFGEFTPEQKKLLAKNAFCATPTDQIQLFFIYEQNDYKNIPSFITTDSVLQVYHIFYDFTLRSLETGKLYGILETLSDAMVKESKAVAGRMSDPEWKKAASANQVYFAVPERLLGKQVQLPSAQQRKMLAKELDLLEKAEGRVLSALFPWKPDYSQFIPRGHYTRSDKLKRYFKAMMWYGYMPLPVDAPEVSTPEGMIGGGPAWTQIRQALLITKMLFDSEINGKPAIETWERIYEPTVFYVGSSDDLTPYQYKAVTDKVYGSNVTYAQLQDEEKLKQVYAELKKLPMPRIDVQLWEMPSGRMLKFMGQRYIPDSEIMQGLVEPLQRLFPKGLDVMAVLGSRRAADVMDNVYKASEKWSWYGPRRDRLLKEFNAVPTRTWRSNLYWGWMWSLDSLLDPFGEGYPSFMTNQAWLDKSLNASLGSWAELRHDTILYAKQSGMECGGDGEEPPMPKGYVEPNVEFYTRLLWLTKASKAGLDSRELLTDRIREKFGDFEDMLTFLRDVSVKELTGQKLTTAEYHQIRVYGASQEMLTLSVIEGGASRWYEITSEADKDMAVIADVHTGGDKCLEEGVGYANEIYVVVPIEGKLYLTRGAVFSYHEFIHPLRDRLTDEKWQKMLKEGTAPPPPVWTKSFLTGTKREIPIPRKVRTTGC